MRKDRTTLKLEAMNRRLLAFTVFGLLFLLGAILISMAYVKPVHAQSVPDRVIKLSWSVSNAEDDVKGYQVYISDSPTEGWSPAGDFIDFNPMANTEGVTTLSSNYELVVPTGQVVTKYFTVTATDTSGNESAFASPVSVVIDKQPPAPPTGFTVVVEIKVVEPAQ